MERDGVNLLKAMTRGCLCLCLTFAGVFHAQELTEEQFLESSLRDRTALHYDPLLDAPLDSLVKLYRGAGRVDEVIGLYKSHIEQYPDDAGAKTVLIRLLRKVDRGGADELIASSVPLHPDFAPLQYVYFRFLEERGDTRAPEVLSRAIDLEANPARRNEWLEQLLQLSEGDATRDLANAQFDKLLAVENQSHENLLGLARLMQRYQFWNPSIVALGKARATQPAPAPEALVEVDLMLANAQAQLGNRTEAGKLLDALLTRLAPDHWRRREIMSLRVSVLATEEERFAMLNSLKEAYRKNPLSEVAALDYAELLIASEKRAEAIALILAASAVLPQSSLIEARALELLESAPDPKVYSQFLVQRLEREPARIDLRFRLVKSLYAQGQDAAAEQDFKAVVAGLLPDEVSGRILELQRYLRTIDRIDAAAPYLENYLRNHPSQLDVARELVEIYFSSNSREAIDALVRLLSPGNAEVADVLDFSEFLVRAEFFNSARLVLNAKLAVEPRQFELGLLLIEVLGKMGDSAEVEKQTNIVREMTDTTARYAQWLSKSVEAHRLLETLPGFFDAEQNRFRFAEGDWPEDKVEKFLILCETGKQQLLTDRVSRAIRDQLAQVGLEAQLRMRLRNLLVAVLENRPEATGEVEEQLKLLATEDPTNQLEYDLRRALVYHRSQRTDLAQQLVSGIDLTEITSTPLLREAVDILIEYGFLKEADSALGAINRLEPRDLLSWERRLLVLVTLRQETTFRSVIRALRSGDAGITLRELSRLSLDEHLSSSYWRSISALMTSGESELEAILPLLASAEREELTSRSRLWTEWTRALVLTRLGRADEAKEAINRFSDHAKSQSITSLNFPDGLVLSVDSASDFLSPHAIGGGEKTIATADFLLSEPTLRWAFEIQDAGRILSFGRAGKFIVVFDDQGTVHALDAVTGKLIWSKSFNEAGWNEHRRRPAAFEDVAVPAYLSRPMLEAELTGKAPRSFSLSGDRFFLVRDGEFCAFAVSDGSLIWKAPLPLQEESGKGMRKSGGRAGVSFAVEGEIAVVFDPLTQSLSCFEIINGKLLWQLSIGEVPEGFDEGIYSLNSGLALKDGHVFVYGKDATIIDAGSGKVVWRFTGNDPVIFPVVLREERKELPEKVAEPAATIKPEGQVIKNAPALFDFQAKFDAGFLNPSGFLGAPSSLVGPGVFWAKSRVGRDEASFAEISEGYLLLMQGDKIRRISVRLPVASRELPAGGSFLGESGNHAWFLDGPFLYHVDFLSERSSRLALGDLGNPSTYRATLTGNQLLVRGSRGMKLINARTAQVIGQGALPPALTEYLKQSEKAETEPAAEKPVWQGRIYHDGPGQPGYCLPVTDLISDGQYISVFGHTSLVCLESTASAAAPLTSPIVPLPVPAPK